MIRIKISTSFPDEPLIRQLPPMEGVEFAINDPDPRCDWFVAFDGPARDPVQVLCPWEHRFLITTEPPPLRFYQPVFVRQFATIYSCHERLEFHRDLRLAQQGMPWHIGMHPTAERPRPLTYQDFRRMEPNKTKMLSVICSNSTATRGHRDRLEFVQAIQEHFKDQMDVFGRGIREIPDKYEALAPYRFHLALENSAFRDYWTEKLADAYLGWAFPIYFGCPNIHAYFGPDQVAAIDIADPHGAIETIERLLADGYDKRLGAIQAARELVLDRYNFFSMVMAHVRGEESGPKPLLDSIIFSNEACQGGMYRTAKRVWKLLPKRIKRMVK